jgi:hypothetical protein
VKRHFTKLRCSDGLSQADMSVMLRKVVSICGDLPERMCLEAAICPKFGSKSCMLPV